MLYENIWRGVIYGFFIVAEIHTRIITRTNLFPLLNIPMAYFSPHPNINLRGEECEIISPGIVWFLGTSTLLWVSFWGWLYFFSSLVLLYLSISEKTENLWRNFTVRKKSFRSTKRDFSFLKMENFPQDFSREKIFISSSAFRGLKSFLK